MPKEPTRKRSRDIEGILKTLRTGKSFFFAGHLRPDGDTIGSALALAHALKALGKRSEIFSQDPLPETLRILPGISQVRVGTRPKKRYDAAILLECSTPDRMGDLLDRGRQAAVIINIDHHRTAAAHGTYNLIDPAASSSAEQVYEIIKRLKAPVTREIAVCLYVGMATDTGCFQYSNTTPRTLRIASELLETGIPVGRLNHALFSTMPFPSLKLLGRALGSIRLECGGRLAVLTLTGKDFSAAGAGLEHCEEIVNYGLMPPGIEASVLLKEQRHTVYASLRSSGRVDVSAVASRFGGGGHHNAAGCRLAPPLSRAVLQIETALCAAIKDAVRQSRR